MLQYLKHGTFPDLSFEQEQTRIRARSNRYSNEDSQQVHQASGKSVPEVDDRGLLPNFRDWLA